MIKSDIDYFREEDNFLKISQIDSILVRGESKAKPFITVLIPTYRRPVYLKQCLDSALSQINCESISYQIIVLDNDPERYCETENLIASYDDEKLLYYKNQVNLEMMGNWNRGVELSQSKWILLVHDDDLLSPHFLSYCSPYLTGNLAILKPVSIKFSEEKPEFSMPKINIKKKKITLIDALWACPIGAPTNIVFNRDSVIALGGFNEEHYPASDYVFAAKCADKYPVYKLSASLGGYRVVANESLKEATMNLYYTNRYFISCYIMRRFKFKWSIIELIQSSLIPTTTKATNSFYGVNHSFDVEVLELKSQNAFTRFLVKGAYAIFIKILNVKRRFAS